MPQHDTIDRITPTLEPESPVLMHQNWHHLLFLHWAVPAADLQALVPSGLTIDTFDGNAYVGLVPFTMTGIRAVSMPPIPGLSAMHEVNVRTYVHKGGADPGVWFFSLDANSTVAVAAARMAFHLNYYRAEMELRASSDPLPVVEFRTQRDDDRGPMPANGTFRYRPLEGAVKPADPGTLEHFLLERYILYAEDTSKQLYRGRVSHQPYPVQRAEVLELDETLIWAAGIRRSEEAPLRHYAREVNVKVHAIERV